MKKLLIIAIFGSILLCSCAKERGSKTVVRVAVAGNLSEVMSDLQKTIEKLHPDVELSLTIASSGKLYSQIINGAKYDMFFSADLQRPQKLYEKNYTTGKPKVYAKGSLILFSTKKQNYSKGLNVLTEEKNNKIVFGNPEFAPYGKAAMEVLTNQGLSSLNNKLVYANNISQSVQYIVSAADIGFVALSAVKSQKLKQYDQEGVYWCKVDPASYTPIRQGMVILKKSKNYETAEIIEKFIFSREAREIFERYGYD